MEEVGCSVWELLIEFFPHLFHGRTIRGLIISTSLRKDIGFGHWY